MTSTYSKAGVDIDAGDLAVQLMKEHLAKARRPEVLAMSVALLVSLMLVLSRNLIVHFLQLQLMVLEQKLKLLGNWENTTPSVKIL